MIRMRLHTLTDNGERDRVLEWWKIRNIKKKSVFILRLTWLGTLVKKRTQRVKTHEWITTIKTDSYLYHIASNNGRACARGMMWVLSIYLVYGYGAHVARVLLHWHTEYMRCVTYNKYRGYYGSWAANINSAIGLWIGFLLSINFAPCWCGSTND